MALSESAQKDVLLRFFQCKAQYEELATELGRIFELESPLLEGTVYTVKHRFKDQARLLEKIDQRNKEIPSGSPEISSANFEGEIEDLLGVRIICLRLSDLDKLKEHIAQLGLAKKLGILRGPIEKRTFLIKSEETESPLDMQYSGYSSVHYVVTLGDWPGAKQALMGLKAELQLRTLLEEAWGEVDHKYRYRLTRSGKAIPPHVNRGFKDLALYLQAASRHAENLCRDVEASVAAARETSSTAAPTTSTPATTTALATATPPLTLGSVLEGLVGFGPTARGVRYLEDRISDHGVGGREDLATLLNPAVVGEFREIYREAMHKEPFLDPSSMDRDVDLIPLVNYALFRTTRPLEVAKGGLQASLLRRRLRRGD